MEISSFPTFVCLDDDHSLKPLLLVVVGLHECCGPFIDTLVNMALKILLCLLQGSCLMAFFVTTKPNTLLLPNTKLISMATPKTTIIDTTVLPTLPEVPNLKGVPYRITSLIEKSRIDSVRLRHIEVATEDLATQCRKMVIDGTEFGELARTVSLCALTKDHGGDSGWLKTAAFNSTALPPELVNAALHMVD